ncbi:MAG: hypothetical protein AAB561_02185 [Patescibacteria group bacterium]
MEKKPQILNLRKPEPEAKPPPPETVRVASRREPEPKKILDSEQPPLLVSKNSSPVAHYADTPKEKSWGFVIKQKSLRGKKLLFLIGGIILAGALVWVVSPNVPLLMVVGLAVCVTMIKAYVPGKDTEVVFSDRGIRVNEAFYSSATLASFYIDETEDRFPELSFEVKQRLMPRIRIPIPSHLTSRVRDSLAVLALEVEHEPSFGELVSKKFKL